MLLLDKEICNQTGQQRMYVIPLMLYFEKQQLYLKWTLQNMIQNRTKGTPVRVEWNIPLTHLRLTKILPPPPPTPKRGGGDSVMACALYSCDLTWMLCRWGVVRCRCDMMWYNTKCYEVICVWCTMIWSGRRWCGHIVWYECEVIWNWCDVIWLWYIEIWAWYESDVPIVWTWWTWYMMWYWSY